MLFVYCMAVADEHEYGEFILLMSYGQSTAEEFWAFAGIALRTCLAPFCRSLTLCKKNVTLAPLWHLSELNYYY